MKKAKAIRPKYKFVIKNTVWDLQALVNSFTPDYRLINIVPVNTNSFIGVLELC